MSTFISNENHVLTWKMLNMLNMLKVYKQQIGAKMPNVNKVILMGVLGRDPETKQFPNGGSVTNFSVATTDHWKDKATGERKEQTEWHRITTNNKLAEIAQKYLKKGGKVYIEGSLRTRKWKDQSGQDREVTEIKADSLQLL